MKPAHQTKEAERVAVWALTRGGEYAGRFIVTRSLAGVVTGSLHLWQTADQKFAEATQKGKFRPASDILAANLRKLGEHEAADIAERTDEAAAFYSMGFNCWQVL